MTLIAYDPPTEPYLNRVYLDEHIAVYDKPSGLLSVKGRAKEHRDSLQARLETVWPNIGIVHRLDMSTSGLMVVARTREALVSLNKQFQHRETEKEYEAIVWGSPQQESGEINLPLIGDWPNRPKQKVCYETGKPSQTKWQMIERLESCARLKLIPITGRSHQLRVHLAEIGHPILGDNFYAHPSAFKLASRLLLHAKKLAITHPKTGERVSFVSIPTFDTQL